MENPYTISFGKEPVYLIPRLKQRDYAIQELLKGHGFQITGVKGSGKTVFLKEVEEALGKKNILLTDMNVDLRRMQKISLEPLNMTFIAENYRKVFHLQKKEAVEMAEMTKGYAYGFQVLGWYTWRHDGSYRDAFSEYRQHLEEFVYDELWQELSAGDRKVLNGIAETKTRRAKDICDYLGIDANSYNPYRDRLIKKGVIVSDGRGFVKFVLPYFDEYVRMHIKYIDTD